MCEGWRSDAGQQGSDHPACEIGVGGHDGSSPKRRTARGAVARAYGEALWPKRGEVRVARLGETREDIPMLLRQTLLYLPAQVVGPLAQVVAALVWTHWLAPGPYGLLTFLVASQDLVFLLCLAWWAQFSLRYFGGLADADRDAFLRSETLVLAGATLPQVAITVVILIALHEPITSALAAAAAAYVATRSLLTYLGERARAQGRIGIYTAGQFAGSALGFAVAYALVRLVAATPAAVLAGFALAQALGIAVSWRQLGLLGFARRPSKAIVRAAMRYGLPLLLAGGAAWLAQNAIRIVVDGAAGTEALGLVAVGWGLGQRLAATLAMLVIAASFPLAVQGIHSGSRTDGYRALTLGGILLMSLIVPASVGLCLLAKPFAQAFVAAPFRPTTAAILPYAAAAGALRNLRMHITEPAFLLIERPAITTIINALDAFAVLIGCIVGLATAGLTGAVAGCLAGTVVSWGAALVLAERLAGFAFPFKDGAKIVLASTAMALALLLVPWPASLHPVPHIAAEVVVGVCVYAAALAASYPQAAAFTARRLAAAYRVGTGVPLR